VFPTYWPFTDAWRNDATDSLFGLRAAPSDVSRLEEGRSGDLAKIAATYDISRNHLMKVAYELGIAGYVVTVRGRGGGLRLAEPVEAIILGEVIRKTEPDMAFVPCLKPNDRSCTLCPTCVLRQAIVLASAAFLKALDGYTLGDLIRPNAKLRALLTISPRDGGTAARSNRATRRG
jgi:Rrf2 family transcriptional regulator, nitric oxide-sensitive transcriptional repressor